MYTDQAQQTIRDQSDASRIRMPSTLGGISTPRPLTTLESAISSNHTAAGELGTAISLLTERLQGVLAPESPKAQQTGGNLNPAEMPHSPAVTELHGLRARLELLTNIVNGIAGRLEA